MDEAKFGALDALISEVDAAGPQTPEQQAEQQQADSLDANAREWGLIAYTVGGALAMIAPELRGVYSEEACMAWGSSAAAVGEKYGWNGPSNVPELGLIISTVGLAVPSYLAIRVRLEQLRKARPIEQAPQPAGEPVEPLRETFASPSAVPSDGC